MFKGKRKIINPRHRVVVNLERMSWSGMAKSHNNYTFILTSLIFKIKTNISIECLEVYTVNVDLR